jgi:hypothetical protein
VKRLEARMDRWSVLLTDFNSPRSGSLIGIEIEIERDTDRGIDTCTLHKSRADAVKTFKCMFYPSAYHISSSLISSLIIAAACA